VKAVDHNNLQNEATCECIELERSVPGEEQPGIGASCRETPKELATHMILDNYGRRNHPNVRAWLDKHPRFHCHFTLTSSSWLNLVERWFGEITRKRIRRGVFKSVSDLVSAIEEFIRVNNAHPKPFVWTKNVGTCRRDWERYQIWDWWYLRKAREDIGIRDVFCLKT